MLEACWLSCGACLSSRLCLTGGKTGEGAQSTRLAPRPQQDRQDLILTASQNAGRQVVEAWNEWGVPWNVSRAQCACIQPRPLSPAASKVRHLVASLGGTSAEKEESLEYRGVLPFRVLALDSAESREPEIARDKSRKTPGT